MLSSDDIIPFPCKCFTLFKSYELSLINCLALMTDFYHHIIYIHMKKALKINLNEEKKSPSWEGSWTCDSSNLSKAKQIRPKRYNHLAMQPLCWEVLWSYYLLLNKGSKIHFSPTCTNLSQLWPMLSWFFWKNATFLFNTCWGAVGCSTFKIFISYLIQRFLDQFWNFLEILKWFLPKFLRIDTILHVNT